MNATDRFQMHLDVCPHCAKSPFDLCPAGAILLSDAARDAALIPPFPTVQERRRVMVKIGDSSYCVEPQEDKP